VPIWGLNVHLITSQNFVAWDKAINCKCRWWRVVYIVYLAHYISIPLKLHIFIQINWKSRKVLFEIKLFNQNLQCVYFYFLWVCSPVRAMASSFTRFIDHTQRRATVGRIPLDEWSAHRRDLYLKTQHTTHNRKTSIPPVGFEPTIAASERH
jgi:uncharacterized membrane protein YcgQ (UPF0703/DUF1980 family)